jgi:hypothetical protein
MMASLLNGAVVSGIDSPLGAGYKSKTPGKAVVELFRHFSEQIVS